MDPILRAIQAAAKFAGKHAVLTAAAVTTAGVGGYIAYDSYNGTDGTNGGTVVKQDVAVNDKNGDLRMKMQGLKGTETSKAAEVAKADAKPDNDGVLKKLQDASKDADIKAEAAPAVEQPELPTEKSYIPETAAENDDADSNVLDGNGSNVFKPAKFAASGGGSAAYEQSGAGKASGGAASGNERGSSVKVAKSHGKVEELDPKASAASASGKVKTAQNADKGGEAGNNQGGDGPKNEPGKEISSDNKNASDNKSERNVSNDEGETPSVTTPVAVPTTSVDDTLSNAAATKPVQAETSGEDEDLKRKREELRAYRLEREAQEAKWFAEDLAREKERKRLRDECVNDLWNAFEKEADCCVDDVAPTSNRVVGGMTSADVMRLAAAPKARVKRVTLYADKSETTGNLVALLHELGARKKGERNPNVSFSLRNGTRFLSGGESIPGVKLYPDKTGNVLIAFENTPVAASSEKKPDTKKPDGKTKGGKETDSKKTPEKDPTAIETPDWMQAMGDGMEEDEKRKQWQQQRDEETEKRRLRRRTYKGSFVPEKDGGLDDVALKSDLANGYMTGDELIDEIVKHNREEANKKEVDRKPIVLVPLCEPDGSRPFVRLSADQAARAKGVTFITDEKGAKDAEKDTKRFLTEKIGLLTFVFVLPDDGKLTETQEQILKEAREWQKKEEEKKYQELSSEFKNTILPMRGRKGSFDAKPKSNLLSDGLEGSDGEDGKKNEGDGKDGGFSKEKPDMEEPLDMLGGTTKDKENDLKGTPEKESDINSSKLPGGSFKTDKESTAKGHKEEDEPSGTKDREEKLSETSFGKDENFSHSDDRKDGKDEPLSEEKPKDDTKNDTRKPEFANDKEGSDTTDGKAEEEGRREEEKKNEEEKHAGEERRDVHTPKLYSRVHDGLKTSLFSTLVVSKKGNTEWYKDLPFRDFALFVTETDCMKVDFSGIDEGYDPGWRRNYLKDPEGLKVLSGMELQVRKYTGEEKDNPYRKAFGDGFWKGYVSKDDDYMTIETAAQPSEITFVHETLSGYDWYTRKDWSKDGYRLVWNRYAKKLLELCTSPATEKLFAFKAAIAAEAIPNADMKWADLTVFCPFVDEMRARLTTALLECGIDVLDYEDSMSEEHRTQKGENYVYGGKHVRYLKGKELSKDEFQKVRTACGNSPEVSLETVKTANGEWTVDEQRLYTCSVEEVIKAADANPNLTKLILPWSKRGLHPLKGNLAVALGTIANTKSKREWTVVLSGKEAASRELEESISQTVRQDAERRVVCNPIDGTISVVKKENFPQTWRKAMEACIEKDTWVNAYRHDLEVPGFDFVAPAMTAKFCWHSRRYDFRFEFKPDDVDRLATLVARYVLSDRKVCEEAREVQFTVRGAGITPKELEDATERAIGSAEYWGHYGYLLSFDRIVLKRNDEGGPTEFEPDTVVITLVPRYSILGLFAEKSETIAIDAFDAKDKKFRGYGFYEMAHAKNRKASRLILPKGAELTDEEWKALADSIMFYFFHKKFENLTFESDAAGLASLMKHCKDDTYTLKYTNDAKAVKLVAWSTVYEEQKNEFLKSVGISDHGTKIDKFTWMDNDKLAEIVLQMSKPGSKGHLSVDFDTGGGLKRAVKQLLQDTSVADKRDSWVLKAQEKLDLASLLPYMKTYFALPLGNCEILFCKDEKRCWEYASKLLKGTFESTTKETVDIDPWFQRFCMKEVLEAVNTPKSKVKMLKAGIRNKAEADALRQTLLDFCKTTPLKRETFILRLSAPYITEGTHGDKVLENIIEDFRYDFRQSLENKSFLSAGLINQFGDKGERVFVLGRYEVSLNFMRSEDFFAARFSPQYGGGLKINERFDALPTAALFGCMNGRKCKAEHFEVLRKITQKELKAGIKSILTSEEERTGWTVRFADESIADEKHVKDIADAVSKLNGDPNNRRFVVPMYKDNLFLFVDKDGWARKQKMEQLEADFVHKGKLKENELKELLFLMSLPTSKAKQLVLDEFAMSESDALRLILDHGNRTGWSLTGGWMNNAAAGKSMYLLSTYRPRSERFLDKETFKKELTELFGKECAETLKKYDSVDLSSVFNFQVGYWDKSARGLVPLAEALKVAEQPGSPYQTLELKADFQYIPAEERFDFTAWIKKGLEEICNTEEPGKRVCYLSLKNLSTEQRMQIMTPKLGKNAKRELVFFGGDDELCVATRKPFKDRMQNGKLVLGASDLRVVPCRRVLLSANGLEGLKELVYTSEKLDCIDEVAGGIADVLQFGLNRSWKQITFPGAWDVKKIAKEVREAIKDKDLPYKVEDKAEEGTGKLVFEDLRVPSFNTCSWETVLQFRKGAEEKATLDKLKFDKTLEDWFKNNVNNKDAWRDFTEALAEQPQIQTVNFADLTDKKAHKLYGTIAQWERLLNIPGTVFKFVTAQPKPNDKDVASYANLKDRKDVAWHLKKNGGGVHLFEDASMCMKPTKDKIAVTEKDKRLLWNRTALDCLFKIQADKKGLLSDALKNAGIKIVDFTIGDPRTEWTASDGKKHKWEDVWKFVGSKNFVKDLSKIETIRVYEEYLGEKNLEALLKSRDFKYIGERNGMKAVELTPCHTDDDYDSHKKKRVRRHTRDDEDD